MVLGFTIVFILTALVQLFFLIKVRDSGRELGKPLLMVLSIGILISLLSVALVNINSLKIGMIIQSLFFISYGWILYFLLSFVMSYTGHNGENKMMLIIKILVFADSVVLITNSLTGYAFTCSFIELEGGGQILQYSSMPYFTVHLGISYLIVVLNAVFLLHKTFNVSASYRRKYLAVFAILAVTVLIDGVYIVLDSIVDWSVIGIMLGGLIIYYYAIVYVPSDLMNKVMTQMVSNMDEAVIIGDINRELIFINDMAYKVIAPYSNKENVTYDLLDRWAIEHGKSGDVDFDIEWTQHADDGKKKYLHLFHQIIRDEKGYVLGSFIYVKDKTKEVLELRKEQYKSTHDLLTGIYNREYFLSRAAELIRSNPDERYIIVCTDLRNFKTVNDTFGTKVGDAILCKIAKGLRDENIPGEVYARLSNDHFAILMKKKRCNDRTFIKAREQLLSIEADKHYTLNGYIGIYEVTDPELPVSVMCDRAFLAINTIKEKHHNGIVWYDDTIRAKVLREAEIIGRLDTAIEEEQFMMFLQPQVSRDGEVIGAEALVRWRDPDKGLISPAEFIPVYEKNGLIHKLDVFIWNKAAQQLQKWKAEGIDRYISVNISPKDFFFIDIYEEMISIAQRYDIDNSKLKLELTETVLFLNMEKNLELIRKLRQAGFTVEMDDFGSGYSSISMLRNVHVDVIKIDMGFLGNEDIKERSWKVLNHIIGMVKKLGLVVICEGVETEDEVRFLRQAGCDSFQGYYFARPMEVSAFESKYPAEFCYEIEK